MKPLYPRKEKYERISTHRRFRYFRKRVSRKKSCHIQRYRHGSWSTRRNCKKAVATTEVIKEAVRPVFDNWRNEINSKFNRIRNACNCDFMILRADMYRELDNRAGADIGKRLRNQKSRMESDGCTKTAISKLNKMDIIENDKKLKEIFTKIVTEYEIKYCA